MLNRCKKCGIPETYETVEFNKNGVCNICTQKDFKDTKIDWNNRRNILNDIIDEYKDKYDYDCLVPFSGGKDSTYTLWYIVKKLNLKPLVVQFNHGFMRKVLTENNTRTFKKLGVDVISFTPNWKVVKRLMLESLIRKGDFCWHCHTGIFSYPMHIAIKFKVPLIFWGEPQSEYTAYYDYRDDQIEEVDETRFNRFINLGISADDMLGMINKDFDVKERDLIPYSYPSTRELNKLGYRSVCLGSFIPWDVKKHVAVIQKELNWQGDEVEGMPWKQYPYEKIECYMQGMRDYIKYLKRGYSRVTQMTALDLRNNRISKDKAEKLIRDYEGKKPPSLQIFLDYLDLNEDQFNEIVKKTIIPPWEPNFNKNIWSKKTHDFEDWYREK